MGEDDVPPLGPAGEDGFLGDEAVPGTAGSLVHQVHPALVQPALLKVVVGHTRVVLLPGGRGRGGHKARGNTGPPNTPAPATPHAPAVAVADHAEDADLLAQLHGQDHGEPARA